MFAKRNKIAYFCKKDVEMKESPLWKSGYKLTYEFRRTKD